MAYIQPDGIVEFFGDIGLDSNYENTLYFSSVANKDAYFSNLSKITTVTSLSYTREHRGYIRVERPMSTMYNVGYMRYKNTGFENKWFYAFVKKVNYINNITTEVEFEIDVIMTWMGVFTLKQCFIERQHTVADTIGGNIVDENLETGEYVVQYSSQTNMFTDYSICIFQSIDDTTGEMAGLNYGGIYSGLFMYVCTTPATATQHIKDLITANKAESIVMILMLPNHFLPPVIGSDNPTLDRFEITKPYTSIDGYIPKNKKLFCYPYNMLTVYNTEGESADYRWEFFNGKPDTGNAGIAAFTMRGVANVQPEISLIPENYKGAPLNYAERLNMSKFPQCSWSVDTFRAYIAQQEAGLGVGLVSSALQAGAGYITGNPLLTAKGIGHGIGQISDLLVNKFMHPSMPTHSKGTQTNDLFVGLKTKDFYFYQMCITNQYAKIIDDYFDMFGYAVREHSTPNMDARPYWTYVKTIGCIVEGNLPTDDAKEIEKIFDNGVRFWKDHTKIGNYSLSNAPT